MLKWRTHDNYTQANVEDGSWFGQLRKPRLGGKRVAF
jgi:hypothetical protein